MIYDIIIVGAGPAGLTASIYGVRAGKKVLVLEGNSFGGQIINTIDIENYPANSHISGFDFANNLYKQSINLGVEIKFEKVIKIKNSKIKEIVTAKNKYYGKAIILACGCTNRKLGIPNENELVGKGVSYCATCDGNFYKNCDVAVVGGGNTAVSDAIYLSNIASKVYIIHRKNELRADEKDVNILKSKKNVEFILNSNIIKIYGDNKLKGIEVDTQSKKNKIDISGLFIAVGHVPLNDCFKDLIKVNDNGYVISNEKCHTNRKGIFVAGDVRSKEVRQLVTATSDGAIAAMEAVKYLKNK